MLVALRAGQLQRVSGVAAQIGRQAQEGGDGGVVNSEV
jgi:hypothetical protein